MQNFKIKLSAIITLFVLFGSANLVLADDPAPVVTPTLTSIAITTPASKLTYTVGDALDISGLVVTGTYSDNSTQTETITASNITGFDSSAPATDQVLTITDGTATTSYTVNITFPVVEPSHLSISASVDVPQSCSTTDTDGITHNYPAGTSYLAICALTAALQNNSIASVALSNQYPELGLFVTAINNTTADPNSQYWAIFKNGQFADSGLTSLPVVSGDVIMLELQDFSGNNIGDEVTITVNSLITPEVHHGGGGGSGGGILLATFDVPKAINYLSSVQGGDGSFAGSALYSDWAAIAISAAGENSSSTDNLLSYLTAHNTTSSLLTDNERRAMALLALGQDPYDFHGTNYIAAILKKFDGTQFGESSLVNDDIFALLPLSAAGYSKHDEIITTDINFILSKQSSDGSWESIDLTAAAIQALSPFKKVSGVSEALTKASDYLKYAQHADGGWGNVSASSWAIQALHSLDSSLSNTGAYLASIQTTDGAALPESETLANRIWATSYAIPAALNLSWGDIMQSVSKPSDATQSQTSDTPEPAADPAPTPIILPTVTIPTPTPVIAKTIALSPQPKKIIVKDAHQNDTSETVAENPAAENPVAPLEANALNSFDEKPANTQKVPIVVGTLAVLILAAGAVKIFILK